ncbi:MAG: hypothetical protein JXR94_24260 [Candidatus Hydrogenedentes bacterium]|nr:hypothetical protein [Candidatus Hydrogenedentota bacterium]
MSEQTPERLKQFRAEYAPPRTGRGAAMLAGASCLLAGIAIGVGAGFAVFRGAGAGMAQPPAAGGLSPEQCRQYALRLEEKQLPEAAIAAYEAYLDQAALDDAARAKVCYSVAKLAIDTGQFEQALPFLYQAEFLEPESELAQEIDKKIVLCLDKLGRSVDLRRELRRRSSVKRTAEDLEPGEVIVAELGDEVITDRDLELEIEKLPAAVRDSFDTPEKRADLLKNLVAERLLLDKANRLELDADPEIQEQLAAQRDALVVRKLIADEVRANVKVTREDAERFYKAEPDLFAEPAQATVRVAQAPTEAEAAAVKEFSGSPVPVIAGRPIPGVPGSAPHVDDVLAAEPEAIPGPIHLGDAWFVFQTVSKQAGRMPAFDEVAERAIRLLQMRKEQEHMQALVENTLEARDVRLHLDRLAQAGEAP